MWGEWRRPGTDVWWEHELARWSRRVDIREGQHVVVGKSGLAGSDNAIVLVLSAKVAE